MSSPPSSHEFSSLPLRKRSRRQHKNPHPYRSAEDKILKNLIWKDIKELIEMEMEMESRLFKMESDRLNLEFIRKFNENCSV